MPKKEQSDEQNFEVKSEPLSDTIKSGRPWCWTTTSRMTLASPEASMVTLIGL